MPETFVSIIMNIYHEKPFQVERAILSILGQTYPNYELIIILDDPNRKELIDLAEKYILKFKDCSFIINSKNIGIAASREKGINNAKYEFIAFHDGDDESLPDRIEKQIQYLTQNEEIDVLGTSIYSIDEENHSIAFSEIYSNNIYETIKKRVPLHHPTMMIRKKIFELYGSYDITLKTSEDYNLMIRWYLSGVRFANLSEPLYKYYRDISDNKSDLRGMLFTFFEQKRKFAKSLKFNLIDYIRLYVIDFGLTLLPNRFLKFLYFFVNINILNKNNK